MAIPSRPTATGIAAGDSPMIAFSCLFAMVFAAAVVGILGRLGFLVSASRCSCADSDVYTACEVLRDVRSLLSFVLGAAACCFLVGKEEREEALVDGHDGEESREIHSDENDADCGRPLQLLTFLW